MTRVAISSSHPTFVSFGMFSGAAAFSPTDIANLWGWWDANDSSTVTRDANYRISQWNDRSGAGNHLIQGTAGLQPYYLNPDRGGWYGAGAVRFRLRDAAAGSTYLDTSGNFIQMNTTDMDLFVVAHNTDLFNVAAHSMIHPADGTGTGRAAPYVTNVSTGLNGFHSLEHYVGASAGPLTAASAFARRSVPTVYNLSWDQSTRARAIYRNGTLLASDTAGNSGEANGTFRLGCHKNGAAFWGGQVLELVIYSRLLTADERASVNSYLADKFTTTWQTSTLINPNTLSNRWAHFMGDAGITSGGDETAVTAWADQSGNGRNAGPATGFTNPTHDTAVQNGLDAVRYNGLGDALDTADEVSFDTATESLTCYIVTNLANTSGAAPMGGADGATGMGRAWFENEAGRERVYIGGNTPPLISEDGPYTGARILVVQYDNDTNWSSYWTNNRGPNGHAQSVVGEANTDGRVLVGNSKNNNPIGPNGYMYEVAIFNTVHDSATITGVVNYLNDKWAIY